MTAIEKWNKVVEIHSKYMNEKEQAVQRIWESIFAEILGYSRLDDEIERQRNIRIGSTERVITDIIIKSGETDLFVVELKQHNLPHNDEMELQLFSYLNQLKNDLGILICDKIYIYDYDYDKSYEEQDKVVIDFTTGNQLGVRFIELFSKSEFTKEAAREFISFAINVEAISNELSRDLVCELLKNYFAEQYRSVEIEQALKGFKIEISSESSLELVASQAPVNGSNDEKTGLAGSNTTSPDALPESSNEHDVNEQIEIIDEITEKCIIIKVRQWSVDRHGDVFSDAIYEATRASWKMRIERAEKADYVLSVMDGVVKAMYCDMKWRHSDNRPERVLFDGKEAPEAIKNKYIGKRIPQEYRRKGLASPCLYVNC